MKRLMVRLVLVWAMLVTGLAGAADSGTTAVVEHLTFNGQVDGETASFLLKGRLKGGLGEAQAVPPLYSVRLEGRWNWDNGTNRETFSVRARLHQGQLKELPLALVGQGEVRRVSGDQVRDWSVRHGTNGERVLVIRPWAPEQLTNGFVAEVGTECVAPPLPALVSPLLLSADEAAWQEGVLLVEPQSAVQWTVTHATGVTWQAMETGVATAGEGKTWRFQFSGPQPRLGFQIEAADPDARRVQLEVVSLVGEVREGTVAFTLTGTARVKHPGGGQLVVLRGGAALSEEPEGVEMYLTNGACALVLPRGGTYPVRLRFAVPLAAEQEWKKLAFGVAGGAMRPLRLRNLAADTEFESRGLARPERVGEEYVTYLPPSGEVTLRWREAKKEGEGRLFFAVEGSVHMAVAPGLLRLAHAFEYQVLQGELTQLAFQVLGEGEVTRVSGRDLLSWRLEPGTNATERRLVVQLSQGQRERGSVVVQMQAALSGFPARATPPRLTPLNALRYGGHLLVVNDGAVRVEVSGTRGLAQISREQLAQVKELAGLLPSWRGQGFAYRFSAADYALSIQADQIQPEVSVSQVLQCHLGETETRLDGEVELEIREAPLRDFTLELPADYTVAQLTAEGLSDSLTTPGTNVAVSRLRLVFSQPLTNRAVIRLRLERNQALSGTNWTVPFLRPQGAKAVRGAVAFTAETGLRLTAGRLEGLTEIAASLFPRKVPGLQLAYRLREPSWQATLAVERLARSLQVDAFHLFSVSEGVVYGSSVLKYTIAGTPVASLVVQVPPEYGNLEFVGREVRQWQTNAQGYEVFFHTPVFGAYTLLATYDRKFNFTGETVAVTGPAPVGVQSEQGTVAVVSEHQFEVRNAQVSTNASALEAAEMPAEQRLLFDAPLLAGYRYLGRPLTLNLTLSALAQGDTVHQVVDRAVLETRVSHGGEVVTRARYYVKNQGHAHLRLSLPGEVRLWEARVEGGKVVPVADGTNTLVPLPARGSALLRVELVLAGKSAEASAVRLESPALGVPVLLTEWKVEPDAGHEIRFRRGDVLARGTVSDRSGFAWVRALARGEWGVERRQWGLLSVLSLVLAAGAMAWGTNGGRRRFDARNLLGWVVGLGALALGMYGLGVVGFFAWAQPLPPLGTLLTHAPVTDAGRSLGLEVASVAWDSWWPFLWASWMPVLGLLLWLAAVVRGGAWIRSAPGWALGWTLLAWTALAWPLGAPFCCGLAALFCLLHVLWPAWRRQRRLPPKVVPPAPSVGAAASGAATVALAVGLFVAGSARADGGAEAPTNGVRTLTQTVRVKDGVAQAQARMVWQAAVGQTLAWLRAPAVLTAWTSSPPVLELREQEAEGGVGYALVARQAGRVNVSFSYQVSGSPTNHQFTLPTPDALVNRLTFEVARGGMDVQAPGAASLSVLPSEGEITRAELVLSPGGARTLTWRPRSRDVRREATVFYVELAQLIVPTPGVIENVCDALVRPAQGQVKELRFALPEGFTTADVQSPAVSGWRFDPDQRVLTVQFSAPQSRPFALRVRSQMPVGALPYQRTVGLIEAQGTAGQVTEVGLGVGNDVQVEKENGVGLSTVNLDDFPAALVKDCAAQVAGLTLRRAYRTSAPAARLEFSAGAVEPEVRVQTQDTVSLGEDRVVWASQWRVTVLRAGIFRLSCALPADLELDSISGEALSHWTEFAEGGQRVVTLHLRGRTEGECGFNLTLSGPGMQQRKEWEAPRLNVREASKQTGQLVLAPETGLRLQAKAREGVAQLDPRQSGIQQKGVLAFRVLQPRWRLTFDVESVEPWIELGLLQDVTLVEGQAKVAAVCQYQIDNAGVKSLELALPALADNPKFVGDLISDTVRVGTNETGGARWEVKLQRRVVGPYALKVSYRIPAAGLRYAIEGIEAQNVNLRRGYLALRSSGRLQLANLAVPAALQATEWQSIPGALRQRLEGLEAQAAFRVLEPRFALNVQAARPEAAKLLPARVERAELTSVVSAGGTLLTQVRLTIEPGDKRLLRLKLPPDGRFWHARVNQESCWPWRSGEELLLPLAPNSEAGRPSTLEFVYQSAVGGRGGGLEFGLRGPQFDLPLENLSWRIYVPENWDLRHWASSLQYLPSQLEVQTVPLQAYLELEAKDRQRQTRDAENYLQLGNNLLQKGAPQQARRAFSAAWRLSEHDAAFNEDARVQLHNLKLQQALLGLNQRRIEGASERGPSEATAYTQAEVQQVLDRNSAEENQALMRLAERLIRQQEAATARPEGIQATLPQEGRVLAFASALQVETWKDLQVRFSVKAKPEGTGTWRGLTLLGVFAVLALLAWLGRSKPAEGRPA